MRIRRGAAAEEAQGGGSRDLMPGAGRDEDGVTGADFPGFLVDFHFSPALQQKIELLAQFVVMAVGGCPGGDGGFGEALIGDGGVREVENAPDLGAIFGREWFLAG